MDIYKISQLIKARHLNECPNSAGDYQNACCADLMSDVLRFAQGNAMLITGLTNVHAVRTAEISGISLIIYICGKTPVEEVIEEASRVHINLLVSEMTMFEACGVLYANGLSEVGRNK
jgi:hypothetical protein